MIKKMFSYKRIALCTAVILMSYFGMTIFMTPYYNAADAVTYSWGSSGAVVREAQSRMQRWGYYTGTVDGIYGYKTYLGVKKFQSYNGLTPDGVLGDRTLAALGINTGAAASTTTRVSGSQDLTLLARLINGEARGEPYEGQVAVGAVILNRTRDPRFPKTIAGVIYQPGAFTATVDGQVYANMEQSSINAARDALNGWDPSGGAVYYFNPATATSDWIWSRPLIKIIGHHRFCR